MRSALQLRSVAEAKELPFSFLRERKGGYYLRSVAPSSPKPSPTPLHVRGGDTVLLTQSVASLNFAFSGCGSRWIKFANLAKFDFKFERKTIRRRIFVLDEADLNFTTGATSSVVTE